MKNSNEAINQIVLILCTPSITKLVNYKKNLDDDININ